MDDPKSRLGTETYFIVLALLLAFGILQFTGTVLGTDNPVVSVVSCSMYPEYDRGDVLAVRGVDFDSIEEGEVIVFQVPKQAELEINDERFTIGEQPSQTPIGSARVISVSDSQARIEIDGQNFNVREGGSYTVNSQRVSVREISGMEIPIVHRVIEKREDSLETKGDNTPQHDFEQDIRPEQIDGKVFFRVPKVGLVKLIPMDLTGLTPPEQRQVGFSCGS